MPTRPEILAERSAGTVAVPTFLREAGYTVHTMDEVFGRRPVADVEWLDVAAARGWALIGWDSRIGRRPAELTAIRDAGLRMLCLTTVRQGVGAQVASLRENLRPIDRLWRIPAPWIFAVRTGGLRRVEWTGDV